MHQLIKLRKLLGPLSLYFSVASLRGHSNHKNGRWLRALMASRA
jgi:hypothetical protein